MCCKLNRPCCTLQTGTTIAVIFYLLAEVAVITIFAILTPGSIIYNGGMGFFLPIMLIGLAFMVVPTILVLFTTLSKDHNPAFLLPWLVIYALLLLSGLSYFLVTEIFMSKGIILLVIGVSMIGNFGPITAAITWACLTALVLFVYLWTIVCRYYNQLRKAEKKQIEDFKQIDVITAM